MTMTMPLPIVPEQYPGGWQRMLYAEPHTPPYRVTDTTTQVVWLQGHQWHADLRIPADAPDFSGIQSLEECSRSQLEWLASLTAFAGLTQIEDGICTWHRFQDLCPSLEKDVGLLRWLNDHTIEEQHPVGHYVEHWQRFTAPHAKETIRIDALGRLRWLAPLPSTRSPCPAMPTPTTFAGAPVSVSTTANATMKAGESSCRHSPGDRGAF